MMSVVIDVLCEALPVAGVILLPFGILSLQERIHKRSEKKRQQAAARRREALHREYVADMFRQIG